MECTQLPRRLRDAAARAAQPEFRTWVDALPQYVGQLASRWELTLGPPFEPGGQCSWVAPARTASGADLVLKLGWLHPEALHEPEALRLWRGDGAVYLHDTHTYDQTIALLLEHCRPGTPLSWVTEDEQDPIIAELLRQLWITPPAVHPFRSLAFMCHAWADEFETTLADNEVGLDPGLAHAAATLLRELPTSSDDITLLTTDLHANNVLSSSRSPWLAIDPKPYTGDRTYDPVQHLLNCDNRLHADPVSLTRHMAHLLDLDPHRLQLWLFVRCTQRSLTQFEFREIASRLAP